MPWIEFSLAPEYLAHRENRTNWTGALGKPDTALPALREAGIQFIELRSVVEKIPTDLVKTAADHVWDNGLLLTAHGTLPRNFEKRSPRELDPAFLNLAEYFAKRQSGVLIITVHAYGGKRGKSNLFKEETIAISAKMCDWMDELGLPVKFSLELNRSKGLHDASVTYRGVLEMVNAIGHPRMGICWDLGHSFANTIRGVHHELPPQFFMQRVNHVHIHDISRSGTHSSLTCSKIPLRNMLTCMRDHDYDGILNLELNHSKLGETAEEQRAEVYASIKMLREAVAEIYGE